jgi:hypothetical protein
MCCTGPAAYPNIFGDGTPPPVTVGAAAAFGTHIAMASVVTMANATARSHDPPNTKPGRRHRTCPDNQPCMLDSRGNT